MRACALRTHCIVLKGYSEGYSKGYNKGCSKGYLKGYPRGYSRVFALHDPHGCTAALLMQRVWPSPCADVTGRGEPCPDADVGRGEPSPGADVTGRRRV